MNYIIYGEISLIKSIEWNFFKSPTTFKLCRVNFSMTSINIISMNENSNFLLNRNTLSFEAVTNRIEMFASEQLICTITGISLIPVQIKSEPLEIKKHLVKKNEFNRSDIQNKLFEGNYYVNVLDYSLGEVTLAGNDISERWSENIWDLLKNKEPEKRQAEITLTDKTIKEQILKNKSRFI